MAGESRHPNRLRRLRLAGVALLAAALANLAGCARPRPDVVLVTLDTTRADQLSIQGGPVDTPSLARLAQDGVLFEEAVAPTPITLPSHSSIMTGQRPPTHGARDNGAFLLPEEATTLAEVLRQNGYETGAFVAAPVLDRRYGLAQGFDTYDSPPRRRRGDEVVRAALAWLEARSGPTFTWVHLYDPHAPYEQTPAERHRYPSSRYHGALAYADRVLGDLLEGIERGSGNTLIVVAADHGESLGEHGERTHGVFAYEATLHVPLVVRGPGVPVGRRVATPVALIDVTPTILDLLGVDAPRAMEGRSLVPLLSGQEAEPRPIYVESLLPLVEFGWRPVRGVREGPWKLLTYGDDRELFDLATDPNETTNVEAREPERERRLLRELSRIAAGGDRRARRETVTADERADLAALGYVGVSPRESESVDVSELPDPRERIAVLDLASQALTLLAQGDAEGGLAVAREARRRDAGSSHVLEVVAETALAAGRPEEAAAAALQAFEAGWGDPDQLALAGRARRAGGDTTAAAHLFERAWRLDPTRRELRQEWWATLDADGQRDALLASVREATASDPSDAEAALALAVLETQTGPQRLTRLVGLHERWPDDPTIALQTCLELQGEGRTAEALEIASRALEGDSSSADEAPLRSFAARIALQRGDAERALDLLGEVPLGERSAEELDALSGAHWVAGDVAEGLRACTEATTRGRDLDCWQAAHAVFARRGDPESLLALAKLASSAGFPEVAKGILLDSGLDPDSPAVSPSESEHRARELLTAGRIDEARTLLQSIPPASRGARSRMLLAEALARSGEPDLAAVMLEELTEEQPWNALAWATLGSAELQGRNVLQAVVSLRRAERLGLDDPSVASNLEAASRLTGWSAAPAPD